MTISSSLHALLRAAAACFDQSGSAIGQRLSGGLRAAPGGAGSTVTPVGEGMDERAPGAVDPLLSAYMACREDLCWRTPGFGNLPPSIGGRMAVTEVMGPDGLIPDQGIRFGFLLHGAGLLYPSHRHAAEELYLILSGGADWSVDGGAWRARSAGAFIHHRAWQPHAIRTGAVPMLTAWGWTGDIGAASYSL